MSSTGLGTVGFLRYSVSRRLPLPKGLLAKSAKLSHSVGQSTSAPRISLIHSCPAAGEASPFGSMPCLAIPGLAETGACPLLWPMNEVTFGLAMTARISGLASSMASSESYRHLQGWGNGFMLFG